MFAGTLPAKTTAVAYSIRCSKRRENSWASAGLTSGPYSLISVCEPPIGATMAVGGRGGPSTSPRAGGAWLLLRGRAARRVDEGRGGPGVPLYLHEVEGEGALRQAVPDGVAVAPARETGGQHRDGQRTQRAGD